MAGRVFFTGDIHGEYGIKRFTARAWPLGKTLDKQDYLIILWDFGLVFSLDKQEDYWLNWLDARPWTTLFIDGNHENFPALLTYPVTDNFGGPAGVLRPSVMHLRKRGHIYTVAGRMH